MQSLQEEEVMQSIRKMQNRKENPTGELILSRGSSFPRIQNVPDSFDCDFSLVPVDDHSLQADSAERRVIGKRTSLQDFTFE